MVELLDLEAVARELKVSVPAIRSYIDRRKLPHSKIFGKLKIERQQLDEFIRLSRRLTAEDAANYNKIIHHAASQPEKNAPEEGARAA